MRDVLAMSSFGSLGRTGNQVFQYLFLRTHAEQHGLEVRIPPWDAAPLFGARHHAPSAVMALPMVYERRDAEDRTYPPTRAHRNVDVVGFFQYRTSYYRPWAQSIRSLLSPEPQLRPAMREAAAGLRPKRGVLVGIHIRETDYGHSYYYRTPLNWYLEWLAQNWPKLASPSLYVASDNPAVRAAFADYRPLGEPALPGLPDWTPDFMALAHCDLLLMPNSTFSFAAALLGNPRMTVLRADPLARGFRPIDIWDSEPLRKDVRYKDMPERSDLWIPDAHRLVVRPDTLFAQYLRQSRHADW